MLARMGIPPGMNPADLPRLMDEARLLRERLHRVAVALSLTEEVLAETFGRMADTGGPETANRRLLAKRSHAAAKDCRALAAFIEQQMRSAGEWGDDEMPPGLGLV